MRHGSLFSGIGGFDLAAEWCGWENVFQVEKEKWCQKLLKQNFPKTDKHTDIFDFDGTQYRGSVDIISGGFPCQPFSIAGKRAGTNDDRFLWPEMLRVIGEVQPSYVVAENVRGLLSINGGMVFEQVCLDLEAENYEVQSFLIPACATGAPHRRDRVWIVAYADNRNRGCASGKGHEEEERIFSESSGFSEKQSAAYACGERCKEYDFSTIESGKGFSSRGDNAGVPHWESFPTQSPVCRRDDGISHRVDRIKGLGNAIVPQVAFEIFKAIKKTELAIN